MTNYILTEYKAYKVVDEYLLTPTGDLDWGFGFAIENSDQLIMIDSVIKASETLEGLFDEFEFVDFRITEDRTYVFKTLEEAKNGRDFLYDRLYGIHYFEDKKIRIRLEIVNEELKLYDL